MGKTSNYGLVVPLSETEVQVLSDRVQRPGTIAEKLSSIAAELLQYAAKGGAVIPPEWAARIQAAIGTLAPAEIVESVEKAVGRDGEATMVQWRVDPTQIQFYQMQADNAGVSLAHQLKAHLDYAFEQGWLGQSAPDVFKILLRPDQYRYLQERFGADVVTGEDVINALKSGEAEFSPEDDDPVMSSLRRA